MIETVEKDIKKHLEYIREQVIFTRLQDLTEKLKKNDRVRKAYLGMD